MIVKKLKNMACGCKKNKAAAPKAAVTKKTPTRTTSTVRNGNVVGRRRIRRVIR
jgi:hypothetical protein